MTHTSRRFVLACGMVLPAWLAGPGLLVAQTPEPTEQAETMTPTKLGLRMTPRIARGMARNWIAEMTGHKMWFQGEGKKIELSDEERSRLADAATRRIMRMSHEHAEQGQQFLETLIEAMVLGEGEVQPEHAAEFARRAKPLIPLSREFIEGFNDDCREVLGPEKMAELQEKIDLEKQKIDRFEERMKKWQAGEVAEGGENPFEDLEEPQETNASGADGEEETEEEKQARENREARAQAERSARWQIREVGPARWARTLRMIQHFYKLEPEQVAEAEAILEKYRAQAEPIMTTAWEDKLFRNRVKHSLLWRLDELRDGPWEYHLRVEHEELTRPLQELGDAFESEVLALVTDEQRLAALERVRERAAKHGLTMTEADVRMLGLMVQ